jgi:hypothetical protein
VIYFNNFQLKIWVEDKISIHSNIYSGTCLIRHTKGPGNVLDGTECPNTSNMSVNIRNLMVITYYSGTCAIRHRSFPTSCDIRQFYGPKVFMLTKIKPEYSDILYHPTHSLVPWCVGLDRCHNLWQNMTEKKTNKYILCYPTTPFCWPCCTVIGYIYLLKKN